MVTELHYTSRVRRKGLEPLISGFADRRSVRLSYPRKVAGPRVALMPLGDIGVGERGGEKEVRWFALASPFHPGEASGPF